MTVREDWAIPLSKSSWSGEMGEAPGRVLGERKVYIKAETAGKRRGNRSEGSRGDRLDWGLRVKGRGWQLQLCNWLPYEDTQGRQ